MNTIYDGKASAEVKFKPLLECEVCGARASSRTYHVFTGVGDIRQLFDTIEHRINYTFAEPPVGWASYGRGHYKCPVCKN